jgi:hypothetical protein
MKDPKPKTKINRFQIGFGVLTQVAAIIAIVLLVNVLGYNHYKRWDFSRDKRYLLSDQSKRFLLNLKQPVKIVVFFSRDPRAAGSEIYPDILALLNEYQYAASKRIEVETIDPYRNLGRAKELEAKYKLGPAENVVILDCKGHNKYVPARDMVEFDPVQAATGLPPRVRSFKGEQAITSALVEVTEQTQNKLYFQGGHGEPDLLKGDALSKFKAQLERQNFALANLDFTQASTVPKDATAVAIIGPKYDFSEAEIKALRAYWQNKGRVFVALNPAASTPRLAAFLNEAGIAPDNDRILRTINMTSTAGIPLTGIQHDVTGLFSDEHPATKRFHNVTPIFLGITQSLSIDRTKAEAGNLKLSPLVLAAEGFWGETDWDTTGGKFISFNPKEDKAPPLNIAVAVEKGSLRDPRIQVDSGRMVVVGNSDFLANEALTDADADFALAALNWMIGRENLIGVAPKQITNTTLVLTDEQSQRIALFALIVIPCGALVLGAFAWIKRR